MTTAVVNYANKPSFKLRVHTIINQSVTGVNVKQINIAPTASIFQ